MGLLVAGLAPAAGVICPQSSPSLSEDMMQIFDFDNFAAAVVGDFKFVRPLVNG